MNEKIIEEIYYTLLGEMVEEAAYPGVENAFSPGGVCDLAYQELRDAYDRLCERLGVMDEDQDVETVIGAMMSIQHELCVRMFRLGVQYRPGEEK